MYQTKVLFDFLWKVIRQFCDKRTVLGEEREKLILPGLSQYLKQGRWSSAAETGAPPRGGDVGGPQVSPLGTEGN